MLSSPRQKARSIKLLHDAVETHLLDELWFSLVQAVLRFLCPIVISLYASSAEFTLISFKPTKKDEKTNVVVLTRSDTNWAVQPQRIARGLKPQI